MRKVDIRDAVGNLGIEIITSELANLYIDQVADAERFPINEFKQEPGAPRIKQVIFVMNSDAD